MKRFSLILLFIWPFVSCSSQDRTYVGSTPAHTIVRDFLQISLTDSIDFIRWRLELHPSKFTLQCRYGLARAGTPGFSNEKMVDFEGDVTLANNYYYLQHRGKKLTILAANENILHFVDQNKTMLSGNGGYSYALNNIMPVKTGKVNFHSANTFIKGPFVFEGRTPCRDLPKLLGLQKNDACDKMKWYFLLYTDSVTGEPSHFLMGGTGYRKETMAKGNWQILQESDGRIIFRLDCDKWKHPLYLLKGDDNVLFFIDNNGDLLVGNENFSYTLNRRKDEYPRKDH